MLTRLARSCSALQGFSMTLVQMGKLLARVPGKLYVLPSTRVMCTQKFRCPLMPLPQLMRHTKNLCQDSAFGMFPPYNICLLKLLYQRRAAYNTSLIFAYDVLVRACRVRLVCCQNRCRGSGFGVAPLSYSAGTAYLYTHLNPPHNFFDRRRSQRPKTSIGNSR